jgi:hypothetical protein
MILDVRQGPKGEWQNATNDGCMAMAWQLAESDTRNRVRLRRFNHHYQRHEEALLYYAPPMLRMIAWAEYNPS